MIKRVEAVHYRSLKAIQQNLSGFQILVGPNASGKTTFLDVLAFLGRLVSEAQGLEPAIRERTSNALDLCWNRQPCRIELAVEAEIPGDLVFPESSQFTNIRYEVAIAIQGDATPPSIHAEAVLLTSAAGATRLVVRKRPDYVESYFAENPDKVNRASFLSLGPLRSALANLPADETRYPAALWLRKQLQSGVQTIVLSSLFLRHASSPGQGLRFRPDGANLPWVVRALKEHHPDRFREWIQHLRTALPDLKDIKVVVREDDRHAYLMLRYEQGLEAPSWVVSDGTLRMMALTILAYIPEADGIYLIEEPENGIHPAALQTVMESLKSVYDGQVLAASHSPVLLKLAEPKDLLCFARDAEGATAIVRGDEHPALQQWRGEVSLGEFLAAGLLG